MRVATPGLCRSVRRWLRGLAAAVGIASAHVAAMPGPGPMLAQTQPQSQPQPPPQSQSQSQAHAHAYAYAQTPTPTPTQTQTQTQTQTLWTLFDAARAHDGATDIDLAREAPLAPRPGVDGDDALWPLQAFWLAEAHGRRGDSGTALAIHRAIVEWASGDPYRDDSGGSALAAVSLWRLLAPAVDPAADPPAADRALFELGWRYWQRRGALARGLFDAPPILGALPRLREDLVARLAVLAWASGARDAAHALIAQVLATTREPALSPALQRIFDDATARGAIERDGARLALGKRMERLGRRDDARAIFESLRDARDPDVAADARLQLAGALRDANGRACVTPELDRAIDDVLATAVAPELHQRARLLRLRRYLAARCTPDVPSFERELARLVEEAPHARATFEAQRALAGFEHDRYLASADAADLDRALGRFAQARATAAAASPSFLASPSRRTLERVGEAWLTPALWLSARGRTDDRRAALALLDELRARWPDGPLRPAAGFWRARVLADSGDARRAAQQFRELVDDSPYDYHALRARLHQNAGDRAAASIDLDPATRREIARAYARAGATPVDVPDGGPLHRRLRAALDAGVYPAALGALLTLRRDAFPGRALEDIGPGELDRAGRLAEIATALALRQDASVAAGKTATAANRAAIARAVARWPASDWLTGDWPLAVSLAARAASDAEEDSAQHHADYLAAAYPQAYASEIRAAARQFSLPPELLYAVIRTETVFNPSAESSSAALGLFQFIPPTFAALNARWKLVPLDDRRAAEAFLLSPQASIGLGARWFRDELLPRENGRLLFALMAHNAGTGNVRRWKAMWSRFGRLDDVEFVAATVPFDETRGFVQRALPALWIAAAAGDAAAGAAAGPGPAASQPLRH